MKTIEKIFTAIVAPSESNGQMLYYGLLLYILANFFVKDFIAIILVAVVISIMLGYRGFVKTKTVGLMDFVFGIGPSILIFFEIIF